MLVSSERKIAISSFGHVDRGGLWIYDDDCGAVTRVPISEGRYITLHAGTEDHFAVVHHFEDARVEVTVHRFPRVDHVLSRFVAGREPPVITGLATVWSCVPHHYSASVTLRSEPEFVLVRIQPERMSGELQRLDWFTKGNYDLGYQGIVGVAEIPGSHDLLVSVQRSSRLIVHDPTTGRKKGEIRLGRRAGNPRLYFRRKAPELWADDYDTLLRLDITTWQITASRRLQRALLGPRKFIGAFHIDSEEELCLVPRPFRADVVAIDMRSFRTRYACRTGGEPLEAVLLNGRKIIARDWQTGDLLCGELRRKWW